MRETEMKQRGVEPGHGVNREDREHPAHVLSVEQHPEKILNETVADNFLSRLGEEPLQGEDAKRDGEQPEIELQVQRHR